MKTGNLAVQVTLKIKNPCDRGEFLSDPPWPLRLQLPSCPACSLNSSYTGIDASGPLHSPSLCLEQSLPWFPYDSFPLFVKSSAPMPP